MKRTKFQRVMAFALAVVFLFCSGSVLVGAEGSSVSDTTTKDIQELLNAISYSDYITNQSDVKRATETVEIDAITAVDRGVDKDGLAKTTAAVEEVTYDGIKGLLIPEKGTVAWTTDQVKEAARYTITVEY